MHCHFNWWSATPSIHGPQEAQRLVQQMVDLLQELGSEAFLHGLEHGVVAQMEGAVALAQSDPCKCQGKGL